MRIVCYTVLCGPAAGLQQHLATEFELANKLLIASLPACAAEYSVGLPLAFFVPPISTSPGRLSVKLDVEEKR